MPGRLVVPLLLASMAAAAQEPLIADPSFFQSTLRELEQPATVGEWTARHPGDVVERPVEADAWCARARGTANRADGSEWVRTATFFAQPAPFTVRSIDSAQDLQSWMAEPGSRVCQLATVWFEAPAVAREAMARALGKAFGPAMSPQGLGGGAWSQVERRSSRRGVHGVVALADGRAVLRISVPARRGSLVGLRSWVEYTGVNVEAERAALRQQIAGLAAALRAAPGVGDEPRRAMLSLLLDRDYFLGPNLTMADVVAAFEAWLAAIRSLEPAQKAEGLLVAEDVMAFVNHNGGPSPDEDVVESSRRVAGAVFVHSKLGGGYFYAHSFLRDALEAAPPGKARDRALLRAAELGFDYTGMCDEGAEEWPKVIATAKEVIARSSDPQLLGHAHFILGDAYATIVALSGGADADYADASRYRDQEGSARKSAIGHYRAGLALDGASARARAGWETLSYLVAGARIFPTRHFYHCVYD